MSYIRALYKVAIVGIPTIAIGLWGYLYLLFCPSINTNLLNKALFHPLQVSSHDPGLYDIANIKGVDVSFRANKDAPSLHGIFFKCPYERLVTVVNHGNGSNLSAARSIASALLKSGSSVLIYDYRGYGKSEGKPFVSGVVEDAYAAYNYVNCNLGYGADEILLYGASLGSGVTTELARAKKCIGIIYDSPFLSPEILAKETLPVFKLYPSFCWFKPSLDNVEYVKGEHPPLLIVAPRFDKVIPPSHGERLFELASGDKSMTVFPNSQHTYYVPDFNQYKNRIHKFIDKLKAADEARIAKGEKT